jgi:hypothetical protein
MKITKNILYRIILEEYLKEGGLQISESKVDDLIAHIKGGPRPDWMDADGRKIPPPPAVPKPEERDDSDTYPMDIPHDDAPESEYGGFQSDSGPDLEDQLAALIQGMPPEEVADLFQAVFEKIPGVEMGDPEAEEEAPESLYSPGAEGRPVAGFRLEELMGLIREVLEEGHDHDMHHGDEMYDSSDPLDFDKKTDAELVNAMWTDGMEELIVLDGEGDLSNREEVIMALKNV